MRTYAIKYADSWYRYVNGTRGRELGNGDLYLVTGFEKARSWGIASYHTIHEEFFFQVAFKPGPGTNTTHDSYRWSAPHGQIDPTKSKGYDPPSSAPTNQTTFIHGWSISLPKGVLGGIFGAVETPSIVDCQWPSAATGGTSPAPGSPQSPFSWMSNFFGGSSTDGQQRAPDHRAVVLSDLSPVAKVRPPKSYILFLSKLFQLYNPSKLINEYLLQKVQFQTFRFLIIYKYTHRHLKHGWPCLMTMSGGIS